MKSKEQRPENPVKTRLVSDSAVESFSDRLSGGLICAMLIFSPWAFGTTQVWSIWTMNIAGYILGVLFLVKLVARRATHSSSHPNVLATETHSPSGLDAEHPSQPLEGAAADPLEASALRLPEMQSPTTSPVKSASTISLAVLTGLILLYCLVAAWNARSTYFYEENRFEYRNHLAWLPHSYDDTRSWRIFWNYLALACSFWAVRDWLQNEKRAVSPGNPLFSRRWKRLLWVVSINGALLAVEGILQRVDNTGKLLWLVEPRIIKSAEAQFGPYAYRSNGAQLLNLIWPMTIGLWWALQRSVGRRTRKRTAHHLLLPAAMLMASASILSLSRGGAIISAGSICASLLVFLAANRSRGWKLKTGILSLCLLTIGLGAYVNWGALSERFATVPTDHLSGRLRIYQIAERMIHDYPVFGTGPNTFDPVSQLYRESADEYWAVQVHNDWLETLATFGWVGSSFIWLALLIVLFRPVFATEGIRGRWVFAAFLWIALGGCLIHGIVDFPFQIYSILFLFLVLCALLSVITIRK